MALRQELQRDVEALARGLKEADAAGDEQRARRLAQAYRRAKGRLDLVVSNPAEYDPDSEEFRERNSPTRGFFPDLLAGAGKAFVDIGRGARQLGVEGANLIPGVDLDEEAAELRRQQTLAKERDRPLMSSAGGLTGNIGTNVGLALLPGGAASALGRGGALARTGAAFSNPQTFRSAAAAGGALGALQPVAEDESRAVNVGIGAGSGLVGRALAQPFRNTASDPVNNAIDILKREGVPLDVGQRVQSGATRRLGAMLDDSFITAGPREAFEEAQNKAFTRAVLRTAGIDDADEATRPVIDKAFRTLGSEIDKAARVRPAVFDDQLMSELAAIEQSLPSVAPGNVLGNLRNNIDDILNAVDDTGRIPGGAFINIRSNLSKLSKDTPIAREIEESLLSALERGGGSRESLKKALAQYRNLKVIQNAIDKGTEKTISPLRLSNNLSTIRNRTLSQRGLGHKENLKLLEIAEAGRQILPKPPNSGTPFRQQIPTGAAVAGSAALGGVPAAVATGAGIRGIGAAFNNQGILGNYLAQGLPGLLRPAVIQGTISGGLLGQEIVQD